MHPVIHDVVRVHGTADLFPGRYAGTTVHRHHILSHHAKAHGDYRIGGETLDDVRGPYLVLVAAGERDSNGLRGEFDLHWCAFSCDGIAAAGAAVSVELGPAAVRTSHLRRLTPSASRQATTLLDETRSWSRRPDAASQARAAARLLDLLALWADPPPGAAGDSQAADRYRELIERTAERGATTLEQLSGQVGMTPNHLSVLFRRRFGLTPVEYRTRLRLLRARSLLSSTALAVSEVARESGFDDPAYFARVFRRAFGMTPLRFARTHAMAVRQDRPTP